MNLRTVPPRRVRRGLAVACTTVALTGLLAGSLTGCGPGQRAAPPTGGRTGPSTAPPTTAAPSTTAPAIGAPLNWTPCGGELQCASLAVPVDHDHPDGSTVVLRLARLPATGSGAGPARNLLVNPGGPGGSGVEFLRDGASTFADLRRNFTIVSWDPRGVGLSNPLRCTSQLDAFYAADPSPDDAAERHRLDELAQDFAAACAANNPGLYAHVGTADVVHDMEDIRVALGDPLLNYLGFSYGTLLGARYRAAYPASVGSMVLDGALDPTLDPMQATRQQTVGFERALNAFFADCAARRECAFHSGGDPAAAFDALSAKVEQAPLPTKDPNRPLGPGGLGWAVASALYDRDAGWPALARALAAGRRGDGTALQALGDIYLERRPDGSYANTLEVLAAVQCDDDPFPRSGVEWDAFAASLAREAPRIGPSSGYGGLVCAYWPTTPAPSPRDLSNPAAPPVLVVGATGDPATPYEWAQKLATQLRSPLLTRVGEGHTSYGTQNACIDAAVRHALVDGVLPADGTRC